MPPAGSTSRKRQNFATGPEDERSDREPRTSKLMERSTPLIAAPRSSELGWHVQEELEIGLQLH